MPSILGANTLSGGYNVANSLRMDGDQSDDSLSKSISGVNTTKFTLSFWTKYAAVQGIGSEGPILFSSENNSSDYILFQFNTSNQIDFQFQGSQNRRITNRVFRDPSAWYHIVVAIDTTQGTAGDRLKIYVNGVQETSFATSTTNVSQNANISPLDETLDYSIGRYNGQGSDFCYDGYFAEFAAIYGTAYAASDFGEFDEDSPTIWKPKNFKDDVTFGSNGFYLEFKQSGTGTDANGMGADTSGNDNHFAVNNLTAVDQSTDTCTNNFCTLNPNIVFGANNSEMKEGNLVYDDSRGDWRAAVGTFGASSGKWYYEIKLGGGTYHQVGIVGTTVPTSPANLIDLSQVHGGFSFYNDNGNLIARTDGNTISGWASGNVNTTAQTNDILQVALDMDNKYIYFGKAGTFVKSGDPTSGSTGTGGIDISSDYTAGVVAIPGITMYHSADGSINFGSPAFAISSGNSDANGHGNFEYAVPSGYFALCTKNLAEHG